MQIIWRCPSCVPRYRVARADGRKLGWAVPAEYVGYLVPARHLEVKKPPKACPECGAPLVRAEGVN